MKSSTLCLQLMFTFLTLSAPDYCVAGNLWKTFEKQLRPKTKPNNDCVPPCKIFHSWCQNNGKCRVKSSTDCRWYCECPANCEGYFCETIVSKNSEKGANVELTIRREKKIDVSTIGKLQIESALANIIKKSLTNIDNVKENKPVEGLVLKERIGKILTVNVTQTVTIICPPGKLNVTSTPYTPTPVPDSSNDTSTVTVSSTSTTIHSPSPANETHVETVTTTGRADHTTTYSILSTLQASNTSNETKPTQSATKRTESGHVPSTTIAPNTATVTCNTSTQQTTQSANPTEITSSRSDVLSTVSEPTDINISSTISSTNATSSGKIINRPSTHASDHSATTLISTATFKASDEMTTPTSDTTSNSKIQPVKLTNTGVLLVNTTTTHIPITVTEVTGVKTTTQNHDRVTTGSILDNKPSTTVYIKSSTTANAAGVDNISPTETATRGILTTISPDTITPAVSKVTTPLMPTVSNATSSTSNTSTHKVSTTPLDTTASQYANTDTVTGAQHARTTQSQPTNNDTIVSAEMAHGQVDSVPITNSTKSVYELTQSPTMLTSTLTQSQIHSTATPKIQSSTTTQGSTPSRYTTESMATTYQSTDYATEPTTMKPTVPTHTPVILSSETFKSSTSGRAAQITTEVEHTTITSTGPTPTTVIISSETFKTSTTENAAQSTTEYKPKTITPTVPTPTPVILSSETFKSSTSGRAAQITKEAEHTTITPTGPTPTRVIASSETFKTSTNENAAQSTTEYKPKTITPTVPTPTTVILSSETFKSSTSGRAAQITTEAEHTTITPTRVILSSETFKTSTTENAAQSTMESKPKTITPTVPTPTPVILSSETFKTSTNGNAAQSTTVSDKTVVSKHTTEANLVANSKTEHVDGIIVNITSVNKSTEMDSKLFSSITTNPVTTAQPTTPVDMSTPQTSSQRSEPLYTVSLSHITLGVPETTQLPTQPTSEGSLSSTTPEDISTPHTSSQRVEPLSTVSSSHITLGLHETTQLPTQATSEGSLSSTHTERTSLRYPVSSPAMTRDWTPSVTPPISRTTSELVTSVTSDVKHILTSDQVAKTTGRGGTTSHAHTSTVSGTEANYQTTYTTQSTPKHETTTAKLVAAVLLLDKPIKTDVKQIAESNMLTTYSTKEGNVAMSAGAFGKEHQDNLLVGTVLTTTGKAR